MCFVVTFRRLQNMIRKISRILSCGRTMYAYEEEVTRKFYKKDFFKMWLLSV